MELLAILFMVCFAAADERDTKRYNAREEPTFHGWCTLPCRDARARHAATEQRLIACAYILIFRFRRWYIERFGIFVLNADLHEPEKFLKNASLRLSRTAFFSWFAMRFIHYRALRGTPKEHYADCRAIMDCMPHSHGYAEDRRGGAPPPHRVFWGRKRYWEVVGCISLSLAI